jgi:hypothetical protein
MAILVETCWELCTNPSDLYIYITHKDNLYGFVIGRAAQGHYKVLITFEAVLGSQQSAVELVNTYLTSAATQSKQIKENTEAMPGVDAGEANLVFLDQELINKIVQDLNNSGEVNTHKFFITSPH